MADDIDLETLKLCLEQEDRAEKSFKFFASLAVIVVILLEIAESQEIVDVEFLGKFSSSVLNGRAWYIKSFMALLMLFSITEWTIALIDTNRHPLYSSFSKRKSSSAIIAQYWDERIKVSWLQSLPLLDAIQNGTFVVMFLLIIGMIIGW